MTSHGTSPIPVQGLFEAHLTVAEVARAVAFYRDQVGLPVALEIPASTYRRVVGRRRRSFANVPTKAIATWSPSSSRSPTARRRA